MVNLILQLEYEPDLEPPASPQIKLTQNERREKNKTQASYNGTIGIKSSNDCLFRIANNSRADLKVFKQD
jgi:hypothetical protein